jgi:hypothetical protein
LCCVRVNGVKLKYQTTTRDAITKLCTVIGAAFLRVKFLFNAMHVGLRNAVAS